MRKKVKAIILLVSLTLLGACSKNKSVDFNNGTKNYEQVSTQIEEIQMEEDLKLEMSNMNLEENSELKMSDMSLESNLELAMGDNQLDETEYTHGYLIALLDEYIDTYDLSIGQQILEEFKFNGPLFLTELSTYENSELIRMLIQWDVFYLTYIGKDTVYPEVITLCKQSGLIEREAILLNEIEENTFRLYEFYSKIELEGLPIDTNGFQNLFKEYKEMGDIVVGQKIIYSFRSNPIIFLTALSSYENKEEILILLQRDIYYITYVEQDSIYSEILTWATQSNLSEIERRILEEIEAGASRLNELIND
jgi:hypothetical protein